MNSTESRPSDPDPLLGGRKTNPLDCNICFEDSFEPIVTSCGHIYCWECIYKWIKAKSNVTYCPVCNAQIHKEKFIPIYSKNERPESRQHDPSIPKRPTPERSERPETDEGDQANGPNGRGEFFQRVYFDGFGANAFTSMFFSGINLRTQNMFITIGVFPMIISLIFSTIMSIFGSSAPSNYYPDNYDRNAAPRRAHMQSNVHNQTQYSDNNSGFLHLNYAILFILFMFLGLFVRKIMR